MSSTYLVPQQTPRFFKQAPKNSTFLDSPISRELIYNLHGEWLAVAVHVLSRV